MSNDHVFLFLFKDDQLHFVRDGDGFIITPHQFEIHQWRKIKLSVSMERTKQPHNSAHLSMKEWFPTNRHEEDHDKKIN